MDVKKLVGQMTLEEKARMLSGLDMWHLSGVERRIEYTATELEAPVAKGTVVGSVSVWLDGQELGSTELVTRLSVEKSELLSIFDKVKSFLYGDTMKTIIRILLVIIALFIIYEVAFFIRRLVKRAKGGK